jgi:hypothetical protein
MDKGVSQGLGSERRTEGNGDGKIRREFSGEEALAVKTFFDPPIQREMKDPAKNHALALRMLGE